MKVLNRKITLRFFILFYLLSMFLCFSIIMELYFLSYLLIITNWLFHTLNLILFLSEKRTIKNNIKLLRND